MKLKHWQVFSVFTIFYILIFVFQINDFLIWTISSRKLEIVTTIVLLILFFSWILTTGLFLNSIPDNPYHFKNWLLYSAVIFVIIGYSDLNLKRLDLENGIPFWLTFITTPLAFWGILYTFYTIPKSLKSLELGRRVKFSASIIELLLIAFFPFGIWIIQPKLNNFVLVKDNLEKKRK
jgi:hypothetical protein